MLENVTLQTSDGTFVHRGKMPTFNVRPAVILWGVRVFAYFGIADEGTDKEAVVYREAFAYYLVESPEEKVETLKKRFDDYREK